MHLTLVHTGLDPYAVIPAGKKYKNCSICSAHQSIYGFASQVPPLCLSQLLINFLLLSPSSQNVKSYIVGNCIFFRLSYSKALIFPIRQETTYILPLSASSIPLCSLSLPLSVRSMVSLDKLKQEGPLKPYQLSVHLCRHGRTGPKSTFTH